MARRVLKTLQPIPMSETHEPVLLREVLACFVRWPQRHDTLRGIAQWWLMEHRIEWAVAEVQAALDELVARSFVLAWRTADGQVHYQVNTAAQETIESLLRNPGAVGHH